MLLIICNTLPKELQKRQIAKENLVLAKCLYEISQSDKTCIDNKHKVGSGTLPKNPQSSRSITKEQSLNASRLVLFLRLYFLFFCNLTAISL